MSLSEPAVPNDPLANDPYAWIDRFAADLHVAARDLVRTKETEPLTATELLSAVSELLRALRLGPMELALWFRRRPDEP